LAYGEFKISMVDILVNEDYEGFVVWLRNRNIGRQQGAGL